MAHGSNITRIKALVVFTISAACGVLLSVLRLDVLNTAYSQSVGLYPNDGAGGIFWTALAVCCAVMLLCGAVFLIGGSPQLDLSPSVASVFSQSMLGFCFLALAASVFIGSKLSEIPLTHLDSVLIVLSLVCAVSFFMEAFGGEEKMGVDASTVMMIARPVCCLFISFYFYFDGTTLIHNSDKKLATLFFASALLALVYYAKFRTGKAKGAVYASLLSLCLGVGLMYSVPNFICYFRTGEAVMLGVFFDLTAAAITLWAAVSLLSMKGETARIKTEVAAAERIAAEDTVLSDEAAAVSEKAAEETAEEVPEENAADEEASADAATTDLSDAEARASSDTE